MHLTARWAGGLSLLGLDVRRTEGAPSDTLNLTLYWQTSAPPSEDYTSFVQLLGPFNTATGGPLWVGADAMPGNGTYPTRAWQPGETIVEGRALVLPESRPDGDYYLGIGWYSLATGERLELYEPYNQSSLLVGPFRVEGNRVVSAPPPRDLASFEGPR